MSSGGFVFIIKMVLFSLLKNKVEMEIEDPVYEGGRNGIDLGLQDFAVLSDGRKFANPKHLLQTERKLSKNQRILSRRKQGSQRWMKQRQKVALLHEKVKNARQDYLHKLSRELVNEHALLALEDLHVKGMVKNHHLAKHISDAGWGEFLRQLKYKGEWYGCHVEKINRWYPSSKTCSACGHQVAEMPLHIRFWTCPKCQAQHDRDINAAKNILKQTTVGTTESHASGVHVRPAPLFDKQAGTLKLETPLLAAE